MIVTVYTTIMLTFTDVIIIWLLLFELNLNFVTFGMLSVAQGCFFVGTFLNNTRTGTEEQLVITTVTSCCQEAN